MPQFKMNPNSINSLFVKIKTFYSYIPKTELDRFGWSEEKAMDYFTILLLFHKLNIMDLARLTKVEVKNDVFQLQLSHQLLKNRKGLFTMVISPVLRKLIDKWKDNNNKSEYLFPILNLTEQEMDNLKANQEHAIEKRITYNQMLHEMQRKKVMEFVIHMNKHLKGISQKIRLHQHLTAYAAQHLSQKALCNGIDIQTFLYKKDPDILRALFQHVYGEISEQELESMIKQVQHMYITLDML